MPGLVTEMMMCSPITVIKSSVALSTVNREFHPKNKILNTDVGKSIVLKLNLVSTPASFTFIWYN